MMQQVKFHLYGFIEENYSAEFTKQITGVDNLFYEGIFRGNDSPVINELSKYDVLLFQLELNKKAFQEHW